MKKHSITAGPSGDSPLRSLVAFRHHNPAARLLSTLVAFAIAMLLVVGGGTAYADDTDPAPADTSATADPAPDASTDQPADPATDESADPASQGTDQPADEPAADDASAPADSGGDSGPATADSTSSDAAVSAPAASSSRPMTTTLKKLAADPAAVPTDITVPCGDSDANVLVGGFEIDGDLCVNHNGEDWDSVDFSSDSADFTVDGFDDSTSFTQGDSENNDPSTWHINGPTPNGKSDIGTAYAYSKSVGDDVFGFFAFTNTSTAGGTQQYDVEYNHNEATVNGNGATVPMREPGDLLFRFSSIGNDPLTFTDAKMYTLTSSADWDDNTCFANTSSDPAGGWCTLPIPQGVFAADASDDGLFQEASIKISDFFPAGTCSGVFGTTQIRSVTGNAFATSALKDYVFPLDVTTPSTCGALVIKKTDAATGDLVAGAVFGVTGDPRPGGDPADAYCVFDGVDADMPAQPAECDIYEADGNGDGIVTINPVEPGSYTVTELVAPPGYLLHPDPADNSQDVTVGESETVTLTFSNIKKWLPLDISKTANGSFSAQYLWSINKQIAPTADGPWSDATTPASPLVKHVGAGDDTSLYYRAAVTQVGIVTSNFVVYGIIHVANPNDAPVTATIAESLDDCTVGGQLAPATFDVPAGGEDYAYTCDLGDGPVEPGTNTATVTWDRSDYPQTADDLLPENADADFSDSGSDDFDFVEISSVDKTITVTDDHFTFVPEWVITWGDEADGIYESAVYSDSTAPAAGTCSAVITNTATITGDNDATLDEDSESGQVCVPALVLPPQPPQNPPLPPELPNTGGPDGWILVAGLVLLLGGSTLVAGDRRRRRRS